ncbi:MAG TPA: HAMP domain-containing protein, partial [Spirochaetota bacterium]|nr:HAMP domain-containing protein [Spirochaetota bacterium]
MKIYPKILTITISLMIVPSIFFIFHFTNNIERNGDKFIEHRLYRRYLNIKLFFDSIKDSLALKITKSINSNDLDGLYRYFDYVRIIDIPDMVENDKRGASNFSSTNDIILTGDGVEILIKMPYGYKNKNISSYIELSKNISQDALLKNYYADVSEKFAIYEVKNSLNNGDEDNFRLIKSEFYDSYNNNIVTNLGDNNIMKKVLDNKQYYFEKNKIISHTEYDIIYFPLRNENNIIGVYMVGIQKMEMSSIISSMKLNVLFLIFIEVILAMLSTFLISRILVNPIRKIELFSNRVADGDFSYQLKINSNDEIANLADNINIMVNKLNYTKLLEKKVK